MSIASEIERLNVAKQKLNAFLDDNKVSVPTGALIDAMADLLAGVETGGLPSWVTELNGGVVYFSSDTSSVEISHGLSGTPNGFICYREGSSGKTDADYCNYVIYYPYKTYSTSGGSWNYTAIFCTALSPSAVMTSNRLADTSKLYCYGSTSSVTFNPVFRGGHQYYWLAWRK